MIPLLKAPPSKSLTHRALFCSALALGESVIVNPLLCDDTLATISCLEAFGISVEKLRDRWIIGGGGWRTPEEALDCKESATTYRMISAITKGLGISCTLTGHPSLIKRMTAGNITSQFLSGELLVAPLLKTPRAIPLTEPPVSKPYIDLTIDVQKKFGVEVFSLKPQTYRPTILEIEGDWSSAAFLLAIGVLRKEVALEGLNPNSLQGDCAIFDILKEMGADIFWEDQKLVARPSKLRAIRWDFAQTPDLYPIVAILCAQAKGKSMLTGIERLAFKESDRVAAMAKITIWCQAQPKAGQPLAEPGGNFVVNSTDHRVVMAAAVLNLATGSKMVIKNPQCVAKSFPEFWKALESI